MTAEWKPAKGTTVGHTKFNIQNEMRMRWAMGMDRKAENDKKRNLCIATSFCPCDNCPSRDYCVRKLKSTQQSPVHEVKFGI